jgi:hypothetical protein
MATESFRHVLKGGALLLAAALLPLSAGGCVILGAIAYKVSGPTRHAAAFTLAPEPTLVLVDRSSNPGELAVEGHQLATAITAELADKLKPTPEVPQPTFVDPGLVVTRRTAADGRRLSPAEIARACGAKQVIYVDVKRFAQQQSLAGDAVDGQLEATVWVFDAETAKAVWPAQSNVGKQVSVAVPFTPSTGAATTEVVRQQVVQQTGQKVSRFFTGWIEE